MAVNTKAWYQSSTVWLNLAPVLIIILEELLGGGFIPERLILVVTVVLNILNRLRAPKQIKSLKLI